MVTCIVLPDKYSIEVDNNGKFTLDGHKLSIKDIPFVRYRFDDYGEEEFGYIAKMQNVFKHSCHMLEIMISDKTKSILELSEETETLINYVYVPVTDEEVQNGLSADTLSYLEEISDYQVDRIMMKDNCQSFFMVDANKIRAQIIEATGFKAKDVGICSSPLSFNGEACLTADRARELTAMYAVSDGAALPTLNHECMNSCGCIRYMVIEEDIKSGNVKTTKVKEKTAKVSTKSSSSPVKKTSKSAIRALPNSKGNAVGLTKLDITNESM